MILCLDIGNSQIHGGVFEDQTLRFQFRKNSKSFSSDEYGLFLRNVLKENALPPHQISQISLCSVVPDTLYFIRKACEDYFQVSPFVLKSGVKTGLKIKYQNPLEVGTDRIANAISATQRFPRENVIIIDFGTAITLCAINDKKEYLGGVILPGVSIAMKALSHHAAQLPSVEIQAPNSLLGKSTTESIQSGLYHGTIGALSFITQELKTKVFQNSSVRIIGTGGFAPLFASSSLFSHEIPDLVLQGLLIVLKKNEKR